MGHHPYHTHLGYLSLVGKVCTMVNMCIKVGMPMFKAYFDPAGAKPVHNIIPINIQYKYDKNQIKTSTKVRDQTAFVESNTVQVPN